MPSHEQLTTVLKSAGPWRRGYRRTTRLLRLRAGVVLVALSSLLTTLAVLPQPASAAWSGTKIHYVSFEGSPEQPTVTVIGVHFGTVPNTSESPAYSGYTGDNYGRSLYLLDNTARPSFGVGQDDGMGTGWDLIGMVLSEYTPTFVQFTFGSTYADYYQPQGVYTLREGDAFTMVVRASTCTGIVQFNVGPVPLQCRATPRGMVAMGDSYSSGEGREPYDTGTASGGDTCHRNATAWARVLAASDPSIGTLTHIACSGATAAAITGSFKHESAQIKQLTAVRPTPDVVTISLGGNDVGFASLLKQCYLADCWRLGGITKAQNLIKNTLPGVLASVYAKVRAAAPGASVYAVGYPRIFPVLQDETTHCGWLTSTERIKVNLLGDLLNTTEAAAAQQAGVTYVPTLDALAGHELCTLNSWMAPVTSRVPPHQEEGHPTPRGQEAMEQLVRKAID